MLSAGSSTMCTRSFHCHLNTNAEFIGKLKGSSSHWVTYGLNYSGMFDWQRGYGVLSFGEQDMTQVVAYVKNQKENHRTPRLNTRFETWSDDEDGVATFSDGAPHRPIRRGMNPTAKD